VTPAPIDEDDRSSPPALNGSSSRDGAALLAASGVDKRYGRKLVLADAALWARGGEAVAVIGENGAGKSTLLWICAGLVRPDRGEVTIRGRVGYCPQEPGLFDLLSADEHLSLFAPGLGLTRRDALERGHELLAEFAFPIHDHSPTRQLSGGARQKLNLALALLGSPSILLLDEPYQGFDHGAYISFWEHVSRWKLAGLAVVVVTHLLADTSLVDRVVEMAIPDQRS
jgi:ABC-type multidrug transport system ATPase subunit